MLHKMGFANSDFVEMQKLCNTMGGPGQVLAALKEYSSAEQLAAKNKELREQRDELTRNNEKIAHDNMHMIDTISVCRDLIFEHHFSEQAIIDVYNLAKMYGNPVSVRQALEKYGNIQGLDSKINEQLKQMEQNEAAIKEQKRQEAELRGKIFSLANTIQQTQESTVLALKERSFEAIEKITSAYTDSIAKVENIMQKYSEMEAKAEALKKELQFARILLATEVPGGVQGIDPSMALFLLHALQRFCKAKEINPEVLPPKAVTQTQPDFQYAVLSMDQIVAWAESGIDYYLQTNRAANNGRGSLA